MAQTLVGQIAIVTGASSGIGACTARELARRGARVVLAARRVGQLAAQCHAIEKDGGHATAIPTDVADTAQVARLVERTREVFGHVDVLVNNAGVTCPDPVVDTSPAEIAHLVKVNLLGAMLLTHAVLPQMLERHHGTIISVCSVQGRVAVEPIYSATKHGLRGFSLGLRRQVAQSGVSVSLVLPGNIRTAMTTGRRGRMPGPELIATTVADLITRPRREVIVPWRFHAIVWLDELLPGLADLAYQWRHRQKGQ
jgi:NADP-dependent 3-hydroxy acid dehydrogenase YdfG